MEEQDGLGYTILESREDESSDDEESVDFETSETLTIGGKTSYAAFMDRLDDVIYLNSLHYKLKTMYKPIPFNPYY